MALIHHNGLRVNVRAPEDDDQMAVFHESGWRQGPHKDTDPDDPSAIPRVLAAADPVEEAAESEPSKATKATSKEK